MDPGFFLILPATLPAIVGAWAAVKSARIVSGNGKGNVTSMVEELVDWKEHHEGEHKLLTQLIMRQGRWD